MSDASRQLLWIGAGNAQIPQFDVSEYQKVTLIEARREACDHLNKTYSDESVEVRNELVLPSAGVSDFYEYSLAEFSSSRPVKDLTILFPGLTLFEKRFQDAIGIAQLIIELSIEGNDNVLILDTPDIADELLKCLIDEGKIRHFSRFYVTSGSLELYDNMRPLDNLVGRAAEQFYTLVDSADLDPDIPLLMFAFDEQREELARLTSALRNTNEENSELQQSLIKAEEELQKQRQGFEQQRQLSEDSTNQKLVSLNDQIRNLTEDNTRLQGNLKEVTRDAENDRRVFVEKEQELAQQHQEEKSQGEAQRILLEQEVQSLTRQLSESRVMLDQKHSESDSRFEQIKNLQKNNKNLSKENDDLKEKQAALDRELVKAELQLKLLEKLVVNPS